MKTKKNMKEKKRENKEREKVENGNIDAEGLEKTEEMKIKVKRDNEKELVNQKKEQTGE